MLITKDSAWPPPGHDRLRRHWQAHRALWSADTNEIATHLPVLVPGGYWDKRKNHPEAAAMHSGLALDIARTSADLVAGDTPALDWGEDRGDPEAPNETPMQDAWDTYAQTVGLANTFLEGAGAAAALGGVVLRPAWDITLAPHALPTVVPIDECLPEFIFGVLWRCAFVQELPAPDGWAQQERGEVWRWIEHHEPGQIRHELWLGNETSVGRLLSLEDHPTTKRFPSVIDTTPIRPEGILVEHWPNGEPNPIAKGMPLARSDFQGHETRLDALDRAWASWWRDIDLGKARILASKEAMDPVSQGTSGSGGGIRGFLRGRNATPARAFDVDADVFQWMDIPGEDTNGKPMPFTQVQFAIRLAEHAGSVAAALEDVISRAGYSPQTFGINVDGQLSGTAMRRREQRSYRTRDRKRRYARSPLERFCETLAIINHMLDEATYPEPPQRPVLEWREGDQADPKEVAEIVELYRRALAMSDEVAVAMAHPEWSPEQVVDEVNRLADAREAERKAMTAPALDGTEPLPGTEPPDDEV
ncbi:hypothetical protein [Saccharothrix stipae]